MKISILTLFPEMFHGPFNSSILKKAQEKKLFEIEYINIRDFGIGKHKVVDDTPYGGGAGMVLRVDVIDQAIQYAKQNYAQIEDNQRKIVLMDARGEKFVQQKAQEYSKLKHLILLAGHYEGIDDRIRTHFVDEIVSIGDYVLTGGELPAMVIIDAVTRLIPGVIKDASSQHESFSIYEENGTVQLLEYPQYTKPATYKSLTVPEILQKGNHAHIDQWRREQALAVTKEQRPDLLKPKEN